MQFFAMMRYSWCSLLLPLLAQSPAPAAASLDWNSKQEPLAGKFDKAACPDYTHYAAYPQ